MAGQPRKVPGADDGGAGLIMLFGLWLLVSVFIPQHTGYAKLEEAAGGGGALVRALLAFLFLYAAAISRSRQRLRVTLDGLIELIRSHFGEGQQPALAAINSLINGLASTDPAVRASSREALRGLAGEDFGDDPAAWRAWRSRQSGDVAAP